MKKLILLLTLAVALTGCSQSAPEADSSVITDRSAEWERMLNEKDIDGIVDLYTDDARIMPPNGVTKTGKSAVREEFGAMINANLGGELRTLEAKVAGDMGYRVGTYHLNIGGVPVDTGKYIETWQRGTDGKWRISNDIWNSDNPPPAPEKPAMTHMIGIHKVGDAATWLAAWRGDDGRRKDFAANGVPHVHVMQSPDDPNLTGLVLGLADPEAFDAWLNSDAGKAAAAEDTVDMSTLQVLMEVE